MHYAKSMHPLHYAAGTEQTVTGRFPRGTWLSLCIQKAPGTPGMLR